MFNKDTVEKQLKIPTHIGIIMDGNGRWAKARHLPRQAGHRAGTENLRRIIEACIDFKIQILSVFAFSTENWGRPEPEVKGLLSILEDVIDRELNDLHKQGVQLRHMGKLGDLSPSLQVKVRNAIELTKNNQRLILNIAWNYGGRQELVEVVRKIAQANIPPEEITEQTINNNLFTAGLPDPDLIIRTSGEMRVSNFMIWQGAYAEYYVTPTLWPSFNQAELEKAIEAFNQRERRYGLVPDAAE